MRNLLVALLAGAAAAVFTATAGAAPVFLPAVGYPLDSAASNPVLADLTGDGHPDLVMARARWTAKDPESVYVVVNHGDGTFAPAKTFVLSSNPGPPRSIVVADFDHDGHADVAASLYSPQGWDPPAQRVVILHGDGHGNLGAAQPVISTGTLPSMVSADLDADGWPDLAVGAGQQSGPMRVTAYRNQHDGTFLATSSAIGSALTMAASDVTGDGRIDLVFKYSTSPVQVMPGNGDATFGSVAVSPESAGIKEESAFADLDGDGRLDVAGTGFSNLPGVVGVSLYRSALGTYGPPVNYGPLGTGAGWPIAADLDGDGHTDLAFANRKGTPTGEAHSISLLLGHGDGTLAAAIDYGIPWSGPQATADLDGDGALDIVLVPYGGQLRGVVVFLQAGPGAKDPYASALAAVASTLTVRGASTVSVPVKAPKGGLKGVVGLQDISALGVARASASSGGLLARASVKLRRAGRARVGVRLSAQAVRLLRTRGELRAAVLLSIARRGRATVTRRAVVTLRRH